MPNPAALAHSSAAIGVMAFANAVDVGIARHRQRRVEMEMHQAYALERARRMTAERKLAEASRQLAAAKRLLRLATSS